MTFAEFIVAKTPAKLNLVLGTKMNTIYGWKHLNVIPRKVWPDILAKFPEVGLADLLAMEAASLSPDEG